MPRSQGLSDDSPFMKQAKEAQARIEAVLVIQSEVRRQRAVGAASRSTVRPRHLRGLRAL